MQKANNQTVLDIMSEDIEGMSKKEIAEYGMGVVEQLGLDIGLIACIFGPKRAYFMALEIVKSIHDNTEGWNMLAATAREMHEASQITDLSELDEA